MQPQRTISPVDGRVLVERLLATESAAGSGARARRTSVCELADYPCRAADRSAELGDRLAGGQARGAGDRDYLADGPSDRAKRRARSVGWRSAPAICWRWRPGLLADRPAGQRPGFTRFIRHQPSGAGVRHRTLELPLPHSSEQHRPGSGRRQHGVAQALRPDAVVRGAVSGGLRRGRASGRRVPASATWSHDDGAEDRRQRCGKAGGVYRLGTGGARRSRRRHRRPSSPPTSSWGARTRPMCARTPISITRSPTWLTAPVSLGPKLLRDRADLRPPQVCSMRSLRDMSRATPKCARRPTDPRDHAWPNGSGDGSRFRAWPSRRGRGARRSRRGLTR